MRRFGLTVYVCSYFSVLCDGAAFLVVGRTMQSPYLSQEHREIKALSPQEISDYLSGKGMGLAAHGKRVHESDFNSTYIGTTV